ncbi:MAG: sigma-54 dependent transcriptional regulator [Desulfobacterales bacterium]|nr:sigma-54 dependent transcriptional regulator [Desulfobacterales bacterium]
MIGKVAEVLIIDDDALFIASLADFLSGRGFRVRTAKNGKQGIESFERYQTPLVLLDQKLPDAEGIDVCRKILDNSPSTKVIFVSAYATVQYAVEAIKAGAFNYLCKPFELDELLIVLDLAVKNVQMEGKIRVQDYERKRAKEEKKLIGSSAVMKGISEQISLAASTDSNVLITGETGVGKNVVARAIHDLQARRETFLTVNCSAIPENLMEAEYFGHEKGVFTGADARREGIFEVADDGTLLLDEIGEIPVHLQSKLLSVLEDKCVRRIGSGRNIPVDVRIIATTNQDLEKAIKEKRFRQDLYYRLAVFNLHIPPLRKHPEDIPEIAEYFVEKFCRREVKIPEGHMKRMMEYPWPGNVRELRNVIERASLLLKGDVIAPASLLLQGDHDLADSERSQPVLELGEIVPLHELKKRQVLSALRACSGNKSLTAKALGISLSTLKRTLAEIHVPSH